MPELGKYATEVLSAYGVSLCVLVALIVLSLRSSRRARQRLDAVEAKRHG